MSTLMRSINLPPRKSCLAFYGRPYGMSKQMEVIWEVKPALSGLSREAGFNQSAAYLDKPLDQASSNESWLFPKKETWHLLSSPGA